MYFSFLKMFTLLMETNMFMRVKQAKTPLHFPPSALVLKLLSPFNTKYLEVKCYWAIRLTHQPFCCPLQVKCNTTGKGSQTVLSSLSRGLVTTDKGVPVIN